MNKNILALVFLMAGALLATTAVSTIVQAAYAGGDGDGNKQKAEDGSLAQLNDCDNNENSGEASFFFCDNILGLGIGFENGKLVEYD